MKMFAVSRNMYHDIIIPGLMCASTGSDYWWSHSTCSSCLVSWRESSAAWSWRSSWRRTWWLWPFDTLPSPDAWPSHSGSVKSPWRKPTRSRKKRSQSTLVPGGIHLGKVTSHVQCDEVKLSDSLWLQNWTTLHILDVVQVLFFLGLLFRCTYCYTTQNSKQTLTRFVWNIQVLKLKVLCITNEHLVVQLDAQ